MMREKPTEKLTTTQASGSVFDTDDSRYIWVSPNADGDGLGTYDDPCASISDALRKVTPGQTVVLMPGTYRGDLTIEISGDEKSPVYITSYKTGEAIIENGCWYFYDTSDLVVSGMTFKDSPNGAVSVVGQCLRNRFHSIKFINCGSSGKASCAFYFGGAGGKFNIVEDCGFSRTVDTQKISGGGVSTGNTAVGLMISDGGGGLPLTNYVIRHNTFSGYDRAVIVGTEDGQGFDSGHVVERNTVSDCRFDGITVKCGDVVVRRNAVTKCGASGVFLDGGGYSVAEGNRISYCNSGISVNGPGHTVTGNAIAACEPHAVNPFGCHDGLIADGNTVTKEPRADAGFDDQDDADEGYKTAFMPDDDGVDADEDEGTITGDAERDAFLNYMFNLGN